MSSSHGKPGPASNPTAGAAHKPGPASNPTAGAAHKKGGGIDAKHKGEALAPPLADADKDSQRTSAVPTNSHGGVFVNKIDY